MRCLRLLQRSWHKYLSHSFNQFEPTPLTHDNSPLNDHHISLTFAALRDNGTDERAKGWLRLHFGLQAAPILFYFFRRRLASTPRPVAKPRTVSGSGTGAVERTKPMGRPFNVAE